MRGHYYLWNDREQLHVWSADGYDAWDNTGWACDENDVRLEGKENASGISLPIEIMDEYVVMRLAQLILEGKIVETFINCLHSDGQSGNVGSMVLEKNEEELKRALAQIELEEPNPL